MVYELMGKPRLREMKKLFWVYIFQNFELGFQPTSAGHQSPCFFQISAWGKRVRDKKYSQRSRNVHAGEFGEIQKQLMFFSFIPVYSLYHN